MEEKLRMKQFISNQTYHEVWKILELKKETKERIPEDILKHIYKKAMKSGYRFEPDVQAEILNQVSRDALVLYVFLFLQYAANENEKVQLKEILIQNEIKRKKRYNAYRETTGN